MSVLVAQRLTLRVEPLEYDPVVALAHLPAHSHTAGVKRPDEWKKFCDNIDMLLDMILRRS